MNRQQIIDALTAAGVDCSTLTDAVPDEFLQGILAAIQKNNTNPAPGDPTAQMADGGLGAIGGLAGGAGGAAAPAGTAAAGGLGGIAAAAAGAVGQPPSQVLMKFNQDFPGILGFLQGINQNVARLTADNQAIQRNQATIIDGAKESVIQSFFDRTNGPNGTGQVTEAMIPGLKKLLIACDHAAVRKFADATLKSADGKNQGTALQESIADLERSLPIQRDFRRKVEQRAVTASGSNGMTAERRARILKGAGVKEPAAK